jgi:ankyrin repeat protein
MKNLRLIWICSFIFLFWKVPVFATPLTDAIEVNNVSGVIWQLESNLESHPEMLYECNDFGENPLFIAIGKRNPVITELLIDAGADLYQEDLFGETPLVAAIHYGGIEIVRLLLEAGVRVDEYNASFDATPLEWVKQQKQEKLVELLNSSLLQVGQKSAREFINRSSLDSRMQPAGARKTKPSSVKSPDKKYVWLGMLDWGPSLL